MSKCSFIHSFLPSTFPALFIHSGYISKGLLKSKYCTKLARCLSSQLPRNNCSLDVIFREGGKFVLHPGLCPSMSPGLGDDHAARTTKGDAQLQS